MPFNSLNKILITSDEEAKEIVTPDAENNLSNWLVDLAFVLGGILLIPFTGGLSLGANIALETGLAAVNASIDAGIDFATGKGADAPYEFLGVLLAPLGGSVDLIKENLKITPKFLQRIFRNFPEIYKKDNLLTLIISDDLKKIFRRSYSSERVEPNLIQLLKRKDFFNHIKYIKDKYTIISDSITELNLNATSTTYLYATSYQDLLKTHLNELNKVEKYAARIGNEIFDIENRIKSGILKRLTFRGLLSRLFKYIANYLLNLKKLANLIASPTNALVNDVFKFVNRQLSKIGYFRFLRKLEQRLTKKWFKGNVSVLGVINTIALKQFNLLPLDSDWILGVRLIRKHIKGFEWPPTDMQIMFNAITTQHFGERGANAEPWGKQAVTVKNITQKEYKDFINSESPGRFYLDHFAYNVNRTHNGWDLSIAHRLISVVPGLNILVDIKENYENIKRLFNTQFGEFFTSSNIITKLINKATRLLPFRHLRFLVRTITYQIYHPNTIKLSQQLARQLGMKFSRSSLAIGTHGGSFKIYKAHRAKLNKLRSFKL